MISIWEIKYTGEKRMMDDDGDDKGKVIVCSAVQYLKIRTSPKIAYSFKRIKWLLLG